MGTAVAQWLRCFSTNRKVAGSIPAGVSGFFFDINPSVRTMVLGLTQSLTEMSTRSTFPGGKSGRCVRLTTYHHTVSSRNLGTLTSLEPSGPVQVCNGTALPLLVDITFCCYVIFHQVISRFLTIPSFQDTTHILLSGNSKRMLTQSGLLLLNGQFLTVSCECGKRNNVYEKYSFSMLTF